MSKTAPYRSIANPAAEPEYSAGQLDPGQPPKKRNLKLLGKLLGIALAVISFVFMPESLSFDARATAAVGVLMGTWWITEAIPLAATALLPLVLFPIFGVASLGDLGSSYASSTILLFFGGFLVALALQRWNLHKRIALNIVLFVGTKPIRLIAGFMIATALLGMWVSNTATAMMMIPMGMSVVALVEDQGLLPKRSRLGTGLIIAIAYAATISAFGTIIGSPVNVIVASYIRETLGQDITFLQWMSFGLPLVIVFLIIGWVVIALWLWRPETKELRGGKELFQKQLADMGPMCFGERMVAVLFLATALSWILVPLIFEDPVVDDATIAVMAGAATFLIPGKPKSGVMLMNWETTKDMPWGVLLLIGGGLALSSQVTGTGLADWIGNSLSGLAGLPQWALVGVVIVLLLFLTEFTSSTATAAAFVPVVGGIAVGLGQDPIVFAVAAGLACLCAFMLPVGTPPNAIAFASGSITIPQMIRTGIWMNIVGLVLVALTVLTVLPAVLGA